MRDSTVHVHVYSDIIPTLGPIKNYADMMCTSLIGTLCKSNDIHITLLRC